MDFESHSLARLFSAAVGTHRVYSPGSIKFQRATTLWNGAIARRPALVVRPASIAQLQTVIEVAHRAAVPVSIRGRGHDWAGRSLVDDGAVIDLSLMRRVAVDRQSRVVTVGGGASAADAVAAAEPFLLAPVTGWNGDPGFTAFILGGGYGPLIGIAGLGADNLLSATVVRSDASVSVTDTHSEPDLFWALRGGGGNFGVVASLQGRLHPLEEVVYGEIEFPWTEAAGVLERYAEVLSELPATLTVRLSITRNGSRIPVLRLFPVWSGNADPTWWMRRLMRLGTAQRAVISPGRLSALLKKPHPYARPGRHYDVRTSRILILNARVAEALVRAGNDHSSPQSAIVLQHFHGKATHISARTTAFSLRIPHLMVEIVATWDPTQDPAPHRHWMMNLFNDLAPVALPGGDTQLIGPQCLDQASQSFGPNRSRVLAVKARYDPSNMFTATPLPLR